MNFSPVRELPKSFGLMNGCTSTWYTYSNAYNPGWGHGFTTKNNVNAILYDRRKIHTHRNGRTDLASPYKVKVSKAVEKSPVQFVEVINAAWHLNNWDISPDGRTFTYKSDSKGIGYNYGVRTQFFRIRGAAKLAIKLTSKVKQIQNVTIGIVSISNTKQFILNHKQHYSSGDIVSFTVDKGFANIRLNKKHLKRLKPLLNDTAHALAVRYGFDFIAISLTQSIEHQHRYNLFQGQTMATSISKFSTRPKLKFPTIQER